MPVSNKSSVASYKGQPQGVNRMSAAAARRMLTPEDKKAIPAFGKKFNCPGHPEDGQWQEDRIVKHVIDRLMLSDIERRMRVMRMQDIDVQLSGYIKLETQQEKDDDKNNKKGKTPKPVKHNIPLAGAQIDEIVTYCMSLFAPETNIFIATSTADKQSVAEGLTKEIGKQGQTLQYFRHLAKFINNSMKYNLGALSCRWESCKGLVFTADENASQPTIGGQLYTKPGTVWQGNVLKSCDMYNFFYDTAVHPVDLPLRGEFFAEVELVTPFTVKRKADQDILFGVDRYVNTIVPITNQTGGSTFYITAPSVRDYNVNTNTQTTNWKQVLSTGGFAQNSQLSTEFAWFTGWINPSDYGLASRDQLECWQIVIANGMYLTAAYQIPITHGQLPISCATPIEDDLNNDQRTYAEMLIPFQTFASFLLNTHVDATRKAIYGITVFDKSAFPGLDLGHDDLIGSHIPYKPSVSGLDIDKVFRHYNDAPQTDGNVEMIQKIHDLMQLILPTNMASQVADLERATEYQAAATVQATSRRALKIARLINDQAISPIKFQMLYNIYQNIPVITYTGTDGNEVKITPKEILEAAIEFDIGTGLKGMDRLMQISIFKDLMAYLFQVKGMDQQVDLLGLLSYVCQIAGFETDLSRFRIKTPAQATAANAAAEAAGGTVGENAANNGPQPAGGAPALMAAE